MIQTSLEVISIVITMLMIIHALLLVTGREKYSFIEMENYDLFFHRHVFNMINKKIRIKFLLFNVMIMILSLNAFYMLNFTLAFLIFILPFLILEIYNNK